MYPLVIALLSLFFAGQAIGDDSCASIDDRAKRLECYDQMFPPEAVSKSAPALDEEEVSATNTTSTDPAPVQEPVGQPRSPAASPEVTTATPAAKSAEPEADKGWGVDSFFNRRDAEVIESSIAALRRRETQNMIFLLANDQVWLQDVPRSIDTFHTGDKVTIKSGTLGGYFMTSADGTITRVRRIK